MFLVILFLIIVVSRYCPGIGSFGSTARTPKNQNPNFPIRKPGKFSDPINFENSDDSIVSKRATGSDRTLVVTII